MNFLQFIILFLHFYIIVSQPNIFIDDDSAETEDNVKVIAHVIPHSHCDPGWLDTFDRYYTKDVANILNGVVQALLQNSNRKFIWAETSFFSKWFDSQDQANRMKWINLVKNGQIEHVGGGWVQHDEANPTLLSVINQMEVGHRYLIDNIGVSPTIGWQIDPFGHSSLTPVIFSLMGLNSMVINRIHHSRKSYLQNNRAMEFVWKNNNLGHEIEMFTHVLHTHYSAPKGFDFEEGVPSITVSNVATRADMLVQLLKQRARSYPTRHLLVPFGDDFKFRRALHQFQNMEMLMDYINLHYGLNIKIKFSTLSEYFSAVKASGEKFPSYSGDFYPYADNDDSYWTGYYTTRPFLKLISRTVESSLRDANILYSLIRSRKSFFQSNLDSATKNILTTPTESHALFLHHDAITGTSRGFVVDDYMQKMNTAKRTLDQISMDLLSQYARKKQMSVNETSNRPFLSPLFTLAVSDEVYPIVVFNSLGWIREEIITLSVSSPNIEVFNSQGEDIDFQVTETWIESDIKKHIQLPLKNIYQLNFRVKVPQIGFNTYFIRVLPSTGTSSLTDSFIFYRFENSNVELKGYRGFLQKVQSENFPSVSSDPVSNYRNIEVLTNSTNLFIENDYFLLHFSNANGLPDYLIKKASDERIDLNAGIFYYQTTRSGAYIFRPHEAAKPLRIQDLVFRLVKGHILQYAFVRFNDIEFVFSLSAVPTSSLFLQSIIKATITVNAERNKEIIFRLSTNLYTHGHFSTYDSAQLLSKHSKMTEASISSNFIPCVSGSSLYDGQKTLNILNDHTMACTMQHDGEIEYMIHRNLVQDDGRGLGQPPTDNSVVEMNFYIFQDQNSLYKQFSHMVNYPLKIMLGIDEKISMTSWNSAFYLASSFLSFPLPDNIHIISLSPDHGQVILRLQNLNNVTSYSFLISEFFSCESCKYTLLNEITLSNNFEFSPGSNPYIIPTVETNDDIISFDNQPNPNDKSALVSQNTQEKGVFLSDAALKRQHFTKFSTRKLHQFNSENQRLFISPLQIRSFSITIEYPLEKNYGEDNELVANRLSKFQEETMSQADENNAISGFTHNNNNNVETETSIDHNSSQSYPFNSSGIYKSTIDIEPLTNQRILFFLLLTLIFFLVTFFLVYVRRKQNEKLR